MGHSPQTVEGGRTGTGSTGECPGLFGLGPVPTAPLSHPRPRWTSPGGPTRASTPRPRRRTSPSPRTPRASGPRGASQAPSRGRDGPPPPGSYAEEGSRVPRRDPPSVPLPGSRGREQGTDGPGAGVSSTRRRSHPSSSGRSPSGACPPSAL